MGITETNLSGSTDAFNLEDGKYNAQARNRENKQEVMLLMKKEWTAEGVTYGKG